MDFRSNTQQNNRPSPTGQAPAPVKQTVDNQSKWFKILNIVMLFSVAVLVVAVAFVFTRGSGNTNEKKYVNTSQYQAVFLNNGQVYFGHIGSLNSQYLQLSGIYYLTQGSAATSDTNSTTANSNYTLVKLGCQQIHDPSDLMLINRDQVTFWENIQDGGQVVTKIKEFQKANPKGPDCSQVSSQTQASSTSTTQQGASSTNSTSTGTTSNK